MARNGPRNFEIHPDLIEAAREARERLQEMEERELEEFNTELERMLVRALWKGHDFLDVQADGAGNVDYVAFDEGHEPDYGMFDEPADRFDLRGVTFRDIREVHADHS